MKSGERACWGVLAKAQRCEGSEKGESGKRERTLIV